jgi:hypothetical protein
MPTDAALATAAFLQNFNNFNQAVAAAQQWSNTVNGLAALLQADPNYSVVLTADDQNAVTASQSAGAALLQAIPIAVSSPITAMPTPPVVAQPVSPVIVAPAIGK